MKTVANIVLVSQIVLVFPCCFLYITESHNFFACNQFPKALGVYFCIKIDFSQGRIFSQFLTQLANADFIYGRMKSAFARIDEKFYSPTPFKMDSPISYNSMVYKVGDNYVAVTADALNMCGEGSLKEDVLCLSISLKYHVNSIVSISLYYF